MQKNDVSFEKKTEIPRHFIFFFVDCHCLALRKTGSFQQAISTKGQGAQRQDCDEAQAGKRESVLREAHRE